MLRQISPLHLVMVFDEFLCGIDLLVADLLL
jgi:hypothetical protein